MPDPIRDEFQDGGLGGLLGGLTPDWLVGQSDAQERLRSGDLSALGAAAGEIAGGAVEFSGLGDVGAAAQIAEQEAQGNRLDGWTRAAMLAGLGLGAVGVGAHAFHTLRGAQAAMQPGDRFVDSLRRQLERSWGDLERGSFSWEAADAGWDRWARSDWNEGRRQFGYLSTELLNARSTDDIVESLWFAGRSAERNVQEFNVARMAGRFADETQAEELADRTVANLDISRPRPDQVAVLTTFVDTLGRKLIERVEGHQAGAVNFENGTALSASWELSKFVSAWRDGVFGKAASGAAVDRIRKDFKDLFEKPETFDAARIDRLTDFIVGFADSTKHVQNPELRWDPDIHLASVHWDGGDDVIPVFVWSRPVDPMAPRPAGDPSRSTPPDLPLTRRVEQLDLRDLYQYGVQNVERLYQMATPEEKARGMNFYFTEGREFAAARVQVLRSKGHLAQQGDLDHAIEHYLGVVAAISGGMPWDVFDEAVGSARYVNLDMADRLIAQLEDGWWQNIDEFKTQYGSAAKRNAARARVFERMQADPSYRPKGIAEFDDDGNFIAWREHKGTGDALTNVSWGEVAKAIRLVRDRRSFFEVMYEFEDPKLFQAKVLKGLKTRNFGTNLLRPDDTFAATIDRHAFAIYVGWDLGVDPPLDRLPNYMAVADAYREVAAKWGITTHQLQAITWHAWRRLKQIGADGGGGAGQRLRAAPHTDLGGGVFTDEAGRIYIDPTVRNIIQGASPAASPAALLRQVSGRLGPELPLDEGVVRRVLDRKQRGSEVGSVSPGDLVDAAVLAHADGSLTIAGDRLDDLDDHLRVAVPVQLASPVDAPVWLPGHARRADVDGLVQRANALTDEFGQVHRFRGFLHPSLPSDYALTPGNRVVVRGLDLGSEELVYSQLRKLGIDTSSGTAVPLGEHFDVSHEHSFNADIGPDQFTPDFSAERLQQQLETRQWAAISSVTDDFDEATDAALEAELRRRGYTPLKQEGVYGGYPERSWLVIGMGPAEAAEVGWLFKQDSVATRYGLIGSIKKPVRGLTPNWGQIVRYRDDAPPMFGADADAALRTMGNEDFGRSEVFLTPSGSKRWRFAYQTVAGYEEPGWFRTGEVETLADYGSLAQVARKPTRGLVLELGDTVGRADVDRVVRVLEAAGVEPSDVALYLHGDGVVPQGFRRVWEHHFDTSQGQRFTYRTAAKADPRTPHNTPVWVPEGEAAQLSTVAFEPTKLVPKPEIRPLDEEFVLVNGGVKAHITNRTKLGSFRHALVWLPEGQLPVVIAGSSRTSVDSAVVDLGLTINPAETAYVRWGDDIVIETRPSLFTEGAGDQAFGVRVLDVLQQLGRDRGSRGVQVRTASA